MRGSIVRSQRTSSVLLVPCDGKANITNQFLGSTKSCFQGCLLDENHHGQFITMDLLMKAWRGRADAIFGSVPDDLLFGM
jgi:hypothetical protein